MEYYFLNDEKKTKSAKISKIYPGITFITGEPWDRPSSYEGDTLIISDVFCLAEDPEIIRFELLNMIQSGVNVKFEKCPQCDSAVIKRIGEEHTALMIDSYLRVKRIDSSYKSESLKEARSSGKKIGFSVGDSFETRKSKETKQKIMLYSKDFSGEMSDLEFMKEFGISRNTFYKYKRQIKNADDKARKVDYDEEVSHEVKE